MKKIVPLPKDLRGIQSNGIRGLTKRQFLHLLVATPILFTVYLLSFAVIKDELVSGIIAIIFVIPIFVNLVADNIEGMTLIDLYITKYLKDNKHKNIRFLNYKNEYVLQIEQIRKEQQKINKK